MKEIIALLQEKLEYYEKINSQATRSYARNHPEGGLRVNKSNGSYQYYLCTKKGDTKGTYLPKAKRGIAEAIAQRDYDKQVLKCTSQWQQWIEKTINSMPQTNLLDVYSKSQGRKQLIKPYEISDDVYANQWETIRYEGKAFDLDDPEIYTERGERVRSKSEKMIADKLYMLGIPYRYEFPVKLKGYGIVYPDFLLLNKRTREEYLLEHFGMIDKPDYANKVTRKIHLYANSGYILGKNLLLSWETSDTPMDMRTVEKMVTASLL